MRPFDTIAALVEDAFKREGNARTRTAAQTCYEDENFRGTVKTTKYDSFENWRYGEFRLIRSAVNFSLGWKPVFTYSAKYKSADKNNLLSLEAISGIMDNGQTGRVISVTIDTNQQVPEMIWANTSHRLGDLLELPPWLKEFAEITVDDVLRHEQNGRTTITGQFDLHHVAATNLLHEARPKPPCLIEQDRKYTDNIRADLLGLQRMAP